MPASLSIAGGDGQTGRPGQSLSIQVRVLGSDDQPFQGAVVRWSVTAGPASVAVDSSLSGATGVAAMSVILGSEEGSIAVQASVANLTPVNFQLTSKDPCLEVVELVLGQPASGTLAQTDCPFFDGTPLDFYRFTLDATSGVQATMTSSEVSTYLFLVDTTGLFVADSDVPPQGTLNTEVFAILPAGRHFLVANTAIQNAYGSYQVRVDTRTSNLGQCEIAWVARGIETEQDLPSSECETLTDVTAPVDQVLMLPEPSIELTVEMTAAGRGIIRIYSTFRSRGSVLASGTAAEPGQKISVSHTLSQFDVVVLQFDCDGCGEQRAYTMSVR